MGDMVVMAKLVERLQRNVQLMIDGEQMNRRKA